ncbi:MAG: chemotaxis protein CheW [Roseiflexus sp.]|nr:chemotaxis protein CheW [Roseiflexus sp.]MCS7289152.1 chemotaxis protein CheW [Roseiflexus sp.]MDW8145231.1 chemotaxis protein CheW [Roseiflexaceae bacterium]MDW8234525.1 chemotaxis protein CheW [Roseiflexaceae bacterium]
MLLIVRTARHRYIVRREDVAALRAFTRIASYHQPGDEGRTSIIVELGPLLDPADISVMQRRHALIIPLRRRTIALLVDAVDNLVDHAVVQPLPPLLRERLREPWATGVLMVDEQPVVQLDVRAIARSILLRRARDAEQK